MSNVSPVLPGNSDESTVPGTDGQNNKSLPKTEDYSLFKFKLELKIFLVEIIDYLKVQMLEMNSFITNHSLEPATDTTSNENEAKKNANSNSVHETKTPDIDIDESAEEKPTTTTTPMQQRTKQASCQKSKKLKPNETTDDELAPGVESTTSQESSTKEKLQPNCHKDTMTTLIRQVEMKRKYLDHVIQVLNQTLKLLVNSLEASAHLGELSSANNSSAQSSSHSSTVSSTTSSPVHSTTDPLVK